MKQIYTLILLLFIGVHSFAQDEPFYKDSYLEDLVKNEGKRNAFRNTNSETNHTSNYDLTYQKLEWTINPDTNLASIEGDISSDFIAIEQMTTIAFDLSQDLTVTEVKQGSNTLSFTHTNEILTITLNETLEIGEASSVKVSYGGNPNGGTGWGAFVKSEHSGTPIIWTLSEPYGAKEWWPSKQDLIDKVDAVDIYVTTPSEYTVASNGLKISEDITGNQKITHWKHDYPIPAYLIAIAITNYTIYTETAYEGTVNEFPIENYVYPEYLSIAQEKTPITADIMELFGDLFEIYPFKEEKYGHAQFGWGGGMEHTTMSFMGNFNRGLIAHELAHQWFGDKVTCGSWSDLWINEGFATYSNAIVIENLDGANAFKNWRISKIENIKSVSDGSVYIQENDTLNTSRLFSSRLTYNKGAMLLHMLRKHIGDAAFFQGIKNFLQDDALAYGYAKSEQIISHFESASDQDLTEFFNDWLYGQGYPIFTNNWSQVGDEVEVELIQTQSDASVAFFEVKLPVEFVGANGESLHKILDNTENNQNFTTIVPFPVVELRIDGNRDYVISGASDLAIENQDLSSVNLRLYPNPTSKEFYIEGGEKVEISSIEIYDLSLKKIENKNKDSKKIDLSKYETGVYIVKIKTKEGVFIQKIIKK